MTTPDLFAEYREREPVPRHTKSCPTRTGALACTCDNPPLVRHAWANYVTRRAWEAYLREGDAAYDRVIAAAKASEES